jgi:hypothetical protein
MFLAHDHMEIGYQVTQFINQKTGPKSRGRAYHNNRRGKGRDSFNRGPLFQWFRRIQCPLSVPDPGWCFSCYIFLFADFQDFSTGDAQHIKPKVYNNNREVTLKDRALYLAASLEYNDLSPGSRLAYHQEKNQQRNAYASIPARKIIFNHIHILFDIDTDVKKKGYFNTRIS